jgi:hypothetical protein
LILLFIRIAYAEGKRETNADYYAPNPWAHPTCKYLSFLHRKENSSNFFNNLMKER